MNFVSYDCKGYADTDFATVYDVDSLAHFGAPQGLTKVIRLEIFHKVLRRSPSVSTSNDEDIDDLASEVETDQTRLEIRTKTAG